MRVLLIRHGQTIWNSEYRTQGRTDIPLDEMGVRQAVCLAERLFQEPVSAVYTSPLKRATETAEAVAKLHGLSVIPANELIERDFGAWEGKTLAELAAQYGDALDLWRDDPYACVPEGAEDLYAVQARVEAFCGLLLCTHAPESTIVVVSHSVPLRVLLAQLIGLPKESLHSIEIINAAYTEVWLEQCRNVLHVLNDTSHLRCL